MGCLLCYLHDVKACIGAAAAEFSAQALPKLLQSSYSSGIRSLMSLVNFILPVYLQLLVACADYYFKFTNCSDAALLSL